MICPKKVDNFFKNILSEFNDRSIEFFIVRNGIKYKVISDITKYRDIEEYGYELPYISVSCKS